MRTSANPSVNYLFRCEACRFISDNKKDYRRHTLSAKHLKRTGANDHAVILPASEPNTQQQTANDLPHFHQSCPIGDPAFVFDKSIYKYCEKCGNKYHSKSGLWKHRKTCIAVPNTVTELTPQVAPADQDFKTMMMDMLKNNQEFQNKLIEMMCSHQTIAVNAAATAAAAAVASSAAATTNYTNSNNNSGMTNSHNTNNTFNLQFFLNEQCKDAMNMKDFVNSIQLNTDDLESVGKLGYVEGMSNILINNLNKTELHKRPVHCSDIKRETLYVKDEDKWEKDGPDHAKMTNAVLAVEHKNVQLIGEWAAQHPRCMDSNSNDNVKYFKLSKTITDGAQDGNISKVIRRVAKNVIIDKSVAVAAATMGAKV
jgi:hypothetical protein